MEWQARNRQHRAPRVRLGDGRRQYLDESVIGGGIGGDQHVLARPDSHVVAHKDVGCGREFGGRDDATGTYGATPPAVRRVMRASRSPTSAPLPLKSRST